MEDRAFSESVRGAPESQDRLILNASNLLISDDDGWNQQSPTKSALGCGSGQKLGVSRRNGDLITFSPPCRSYGHRPCAEAQVRKHLGTIGRNLGGGRSGWVAVVEEDDFDKDLLKDRLYRYRLKHRDDLWAWYRVVKRSDGTRWILSTVPLGGRLPPVSMEPVDDLLVFAADALRLPGVAGFRGTWWPIKPPKSGSTDLHSFGSVTSETKEAFLVATAKEVEQRFGVRIDPMEPLEYGNGITVDQFIECGDAVRASE